MATTCSRWPTLERLPESSSGVPTAVIADTVKGKNISFMEREIKMACGQHERCGSADRAGRPGRGAGPAEKGL